MTIDPTREEWLAARQRVSIAVHANSPTPTVVIAALGPCPPEPPPKDWYVGNLLLSAVTVGRRRSVVIYCDDPQREDPYLLTSDEADAMACSLIEHAAYAREQEAASDACGHLLDRKPSETSAKVCQRPKGHDGACKAASA